MKSGIKTIGSFYLRRDKSFGAPIWNLLPVDFPPGVLGVLRRYLYTCLRVFNNLLLMRHYTWKYTQISISLNLFHSCLLDFLNVGSSLCLSLSLSLSSLQSMVALGNELGSQWNDDKFFLDKKNGEISRRRSMENQQHSPSTTPPSTDTRGRKRPLLSMDQWPLCFSPSY